LLNSFVIELVNIIIGNLIVHSSPIEIVSRLLAKHLSFLGT